VSRGVYCTDAAACLVSARQPVITWMRLSGGVGTVTSHGSLRFPLSLIPVRRLTLPLEHGPQTAWSHRPSGARYKSGSARIGRDRPTPQTPRRQSANASDTPSPSTRPLEIKQAVPFGRSAHTPHKSDQLTAGGDLRRPRRSPSRSGALMTSSPRLCAQRSAAWSSAAAARRSDAARSAEGCVLRRPGGCGRRGLRG